MGNPSGRRRIRITRQSLPALSFVIVGILMMTMPFIVKHSGYLGDVMVAREDAASPFDKTLILIGQESADGAVGIILNKPLSDSQHEKLSPFLRDSGIPVGYGGPLETSEKIFVLEEKKDDPESHVILFDIRTWDDAVHKTPDLLEKIRQSIKNGEQRYRVFTGYAAWGSFQLEEETLLKNKWYSISSTTHEIVFQTKPEAQWDALVHQQKAKESPPSNQT